jgi:DNA polymerase-3 subunit delta'
MLWAQIESHDKAKNILLQQFRAGRIGHAYLFVGKKGIGKKLVAKAFASEILEDNRQDLVSENKHPDFKYWNTDTKTFGVSIVRDVQKGLHFSPTQAKRKVVLIDDGEKLTTQAQNALLKILEEPPKDTVIIVLTESLAKMLPTIISRCQIVRFAPLDKESILKIIDMENLSIAEETLLVQLGRGSVNNTTKIIAEENLSELVSYIESFFKAANRRDRIMLQKMADEISNKNVDLFLEAMETVCELALRRSPDLGKIIGEYKDYLERMDYDYISRGCRAILKARSDLDKYINKQLILETLFIELLEVYHD